MKEYLAFLCCLALASGFVVKIEDDVVQWKAWKAFHGKSYSTETEENARRAIWRDNLKVTTARCNENLRKRQFVVFNLFLGKSSMRLN